VDTISSFSQHYSIDLQKGFPALTTKQMDGYRWESLIHELIWYLSGEEHIRNLREHTKIWNAWADDEGHLDTAYGRFWRRYPIPDTGLDGEAWPDDTHRWVNDDETTFDQLQYVIDTLNENPNSRRLVVNAWHPANAAVSTLPPCHYTFAFNVQGDTLNTHLTQRSGDIALGIPFNIACYSLLTHIIAQHTGFKVGEFSHTIVDAHIYCGEGDHGDWYAEKLGGIQKAVQRKNAFGNVLSSGTEDRRERLANYIESEAPADPDTLDHVPNLLTQLTRKPHPRPSIKIADKSPGELERSDFELIGYKSHDSLSFGVAE
jgi:thymidylate synthase